MSFHSGLMVSDEKVTINLIEYPFYVMNRFSH